MSANKKREISQKTVRQKGKLFSASNVLFDYSVHKISKILKLRTQSPESDKLRFLTLVPRNYSPTKIRKKKNRRESLYIRNQLKV